MFGWTLPSPPMTSFCRPQWSLGGDCWPTSMGTAMSVKMMKPTILLQYNNLNLNLHNDPFAKVSLNLNCLRKLGLILCLDHHLHDLQILRLSTRITHIPWRSRNSQRNGYFYKVPTKFPALQQMSSGEQQWNSYPTFWKKRNPKISKERFPLSSISEDSCTMTIVPRYKWNMYFAIYWMGQLRLLTLQLRQRSATWGRDMKSCMKKPT